MPSLMKHIECPACGSRHHFCFVTGDLEQGREYHYVCPATGKNGTLRATTWESVPAVPQGAVELMSADYSPGSQDKRSAPPGDSAGKRGSPRAAAAKPAPHLRKIESDMEHLMARVDDLEQKTTTANPPAGPAAGDKTAAAPTSLQEVLPQVNKLAGKVGGLKQLSEIVDTLKDSKE